MVGGEINYKCLGNNQYEIMVTVFRDCDTGVPWFDNPASVGVFDSNDSLIYDLRLQLRNNDTLELNLTDPCLVAPPNVCIHTTTYIDTVTLPFYPGGYQVVYQRCCRNQDIVNIINPTGSGATYSSFISEEALLNCNTSAKFKEWPPVYICQGVPIQYDHSALDADGDSIVYELCTPFTGASPSQSMPQPPNNPPYNNVVWQAPYSVDNMLGGPDSLKIDPQTGLLTGTPDNLGVFVVGVCAKEYRNGILISTTRRDFQYVVGVCGRLVSAAFFAPDIQCDNSLIVNFQNNSNSLGTGFVWSFGDSSTNMTSTVANPTYIYPDTGRYEITLIADPGTLCSDTLTQEVYLQYESIITDFEVTSAACTDSLFLDVTDLTIDTISTISDWNWDFGNGQTANIPFPTTVYDTSGTYIIRLDVTAANGCTAQQTDTLILDLPTISSADTIGICPRDTAIFLNPGGNPNHQYIWTPAIGLDSDTSANPLATISGTQTYQVTVVVPNGIDTCILERSVTVIQSPPIQLNAIATIVSCQDSVWLTATSTGAATIAWTTDSTFSNIITTGDSIQVLNNNEVWFVRATNRVGCSVLDTTLVVKYNQPINASFSNIVTQCDSIYEVQFTDLSTDTLTGGVVSWLWSFGDGQTSTLQNPIHQYTQTGAYNVALEVTTANGCKGIVDNVLSFNIPTLTGRDTVGVCQGQTGAFLNPNPNTALQYQWSPAATLSSATAPNPFATPLVPTTYTVTITAVNGVDTCRYVDQVHVNFPPPVVVTATPTIQYCGDSVTLSASSSTAILYEWSGDNSFNTIIATGNPVRIQPLTSPFSIYYVRGTDAYGCSATANVIAQQNPPVNAAFVYQTISCSDTAQIQFTDITADTATSSIVQWDWTTTSGQTSNLQNPVFSFIQSQSEVVTLTVTLANGCTGSFSQVIDLELATITDGETVVICNGQNTVQLNPQGNPSLKYEWSPAANLSNPQGVSPIATVPSFPFVYTVTITGSVGSDTCYQVHDITVIEAAPIEISVPKDTVYCGNTFNVVAMVRGANNIEWSFNPNFNPSILNGVTNFFLGLPAAPANSIMYVRATNSLGCQKVDTVRILKRDIPIAVNYSIDILDCSDTLEVQFTNTSTVPNGLYVNSWNWNFGNGQTANSFNSNHQYTGAGPFPVTLTATATNACTGQKTDTFDYDLPQLNGPRDIGLCDTNAVTLNPNGNPNLTYVWSPATGLSNVTAVSPIASPAQTTVYTVTITAVNAGDTCQLIEDVTVATDSFELEAMADTLICSNQITLRANTDTMVQVDWSLDRDFQTIIGQTNPMVTNLNDSRWFYIRGNNGFGCEVLDSVWVQYHRPDIPLDFEAVPINCGDSLVIDFQNLTQDSLVRSWSWDFGNGQTSNLENPLPVTYLSDNSYAIQLTAQLNDVCVDSITKNIQLKIPSLSISTPTQATCGSDSVQLTINTKPNLIYSWSPTVGLSDPTIANPTVLTNVSQTYTIQVLAISDLGGGRLDTCQIEDSIRVEVRPAPVVQIVGDTLSCDSTVGLVANTASMNTVTWALESNFQNIIANGSLLSTTQSDSQEVYYAQVIDSFGCSAIDSITIAWAALEVDLLPNYYSCTNQAIAIKAITNVGTNLSYDWLPNSWIATGQGTDSVQITSNNTGTIQLIATNSIGCQDTATTLVALAPPLVVSLSPDTIICNREALVQAVSNQSSTSYQWFGNKNLDTIVGQNNTFIADLSNQDSVYYYVQATDTFGCQVIDSVQVVRKAVQIDVDSANAICVGNSVFLSARNLQQDDSLTYSWQPDPSILSGQGSPIIQVQPTMTTNYTVYAQNQYGCIDTAQTNVVISTATPLLSISSSKDTIIVGDTVQLQATLQTDYTYNWQIDSTLNGANLYNPTVQPTGQNTYYVTISDLFGCQNQDSITIYIQPTICDEPHIFIPNAFTPDGDGHNDQIIPMGGVITEIYFVIYNRWGQPIFETEEIGKGWDGTYQGKQLSPDVYGYYIQCKCLDGNQFFKKGNITLIR